MRKTIRLLSYILLMALVLAVSVAAQKPAPDQAVRSAPAQPGITAAGPDRVEIIERRTRTSKHYLNPDGTFTAELRTGSLHYQDAEGTWQDPPLPTHSPPTGTATPQFFVPTRVPRTPTPVPVSSFPPATPWAPQGYFPRHDSPSPVTTVERAIELATIGIRAARYLTMDVASGGVARKTTWGEVERLTNQQVYSRAKDREVWLVAFEGGGSISGPSGPGPAAPPKTGHYYAFVVLDAATGNTLEVRAAQNPLWTPWS